MYDFIDRHIIKRKEFDFFSLKIKQTKNLPNFKDTDLAAMVLDA